MFGLGVAGVVSGLAVLSGSEHAHGLGVTVAGLGALGQLLFAQAYPLWSLVITAAYFLAIYGLLAHGGEERTVSTSSLSESREAIEPQSDVTDMSSRRVA